MVQSNELVEDTPAGSADPDCGEDEIGACDRFAQIRGGRDAWGIGKIEIGYDCCHDVEPGDRDVVKTNFVDD